VYKTLFYTLAEQIKKKQFKKIKNHKIQLILKLIFRRGDSFLSKLKDTFETFNLLLEVSGTKQLSFRTKFFF
jgi:hypothetical protein